ncbi:MAG: hypothetical protein A2X08_01635 [Bacteroidetes bacterium GWA2_32_17]|nr:MAG: hypothetical protein A2X08_01635 [Bacteroidetes bacterium GWA2_32_17]
MEKEITAKSSKHEIIEAYNELLTKVKEQNNTNSRAINEKEEHKKNVDSASEHSQESIVKNISNLKLGLGQSLDLIEKSLVDEFKKLTSLQDAIVYEENRLKDMYEIIATAETLETLILTHKEKKLKLEEEFKQQSAELEQIMEKMKADWEKENTQNEINQKEYLVNLKKQRTRDEEEYHYTLQIERKKEEDLYNEKKLNQEKILSEQKIKFEKEITERETLITAKEKEYAELVKKVQQHPIELEKAIKETEKNVREKILMQYSHEKELLIKDTEGERKLKDQLINSLQDKIKEQSSIIQQLSIKAENATTQVKDIALKAVEGSSNLRRYPLNEKEN